MSDTPTDPRRDVALFRYGVIAELLALPPGSPERRQAMREKARRSWTIPGSRRTRASRSRPCATGSRRTTATGLTGSSPSPAATAAGRGACRPTSPSC